MTHIEKLTPEQKELAAKALNAALGLNHPDNATALADFEAAQKALAKVGLAIQPLERQSNRMLCPKCAEGGIIHYVQAIQPINEKETK